MEQSRIDAHQHYWKIERGDYGWLTPETGVLYRDFLPDDLVPHLKRHQIDQTILVQAAPTVEETKFILRLSEETPSIAGVVGWLDLESTSYKAQFAEFLQHPKFVGFRVMIQDMAAPEVILKPHVLAAFRAFAELDFPIDLLVHAHQLPVVLALLEQVPDLRGVIDHLAKPQIARGVMEPWKNQMAKIATYPRIYCKLSGMVTEADHAHWQRDDFLGYVHHVLTVFGPNRVMYGSDWPVCQLAATYNEVFELLTQVLPVQLTEREKQRIFGDNAREFYKL